MNKFEIVQRQDGEHRAGQFQLRINDFDTEYTNDPAQHFEKFLKAAMAEVGDVAKATGIAHHRAEEQSRYVLDRVAERIKQGRVLPGGIPVSVGGDLTAGEFITGFTETEGPPKPRGKQDEAVLRFLHRGRLRNLTKTQRAERTARRNAHRDPDADWRERRKALIQDRQTKLEALRRRMVEVKDNPDLLPKLQREERALVAEIAALQAPVLAASHGFQYAYGQYFQAGVNFVSSDQRIWPLMTNTTADTERDAVDTFGDFTTTDEFDGANYSAGGLALDNQAVNIDDANDRAEVDADDETVTALGAGTRSIQGVALGLFNTSTALSMPEHWIEFATNKTPDGSNFTFQFNAEGILQGADG